MKNLYLLFIFSFLLGNWNTIQAQKNLLNEKLEHSDSVVIREIYNRALSEGKSYENLRYLCKEIGARVTGSSEAQMAIEWGQKKLADDLTS